MRYAMPLLILCILLGCSGTKEPRVDVSTFESINPSMEGVISRMTPQEHAQFRHDCTVIMTDRNPQLANRTEKSGAPPFSPADIMKKFKPLDGLTASEIHAEAEAIRAAKPR